jgi:DNA-binding CsgD family transcriptional regulator
MSKKPSSISGSTKWLNALDKTISTLGRCEFEDHLFALVNLAVQTDHCTVFFNGPEGKTEHLFTKSKLDDATCLNLARAYTDGFYVSDPNRAPLAATFKSDKKTFTLMPHMPTSEYDTKYQKKFFKETGLTDKISCVLQTKRYNIYCSFYRLKPSEIFEDIEFQKLSEILPLLTNLIFKHSRLKDLNDKEDHQASLIMQAPLSRSPDMLNQLLQSQSEIFAALTKREREVCTRIVTGYSSEAISLDLNIAISSVHTYRKRAYSKLSISSQNELFSLCLEFMPIFR